MLCFMPIAGGKIPILGISFCDGRALLACQLVDIYPQYLFHLFCKIIFPLMESPVEDDNASDEKKFVGDIIR